MYTCEWAGRLIKPYPDPGFYTGPGFYLLLVCSDPRALNEAGFYSREGSIRRYTMSYTVYLLKIWQDKNNYCRVLPKQIRLNCIFPTEMQRCQIIRSVTTGTRYTSVKLAVNRSSVYYISGYRYWYVLSACRDCGARLPCLQRTVGAARWRNIHHSARN